MIPQFQAIVVADRNVSLLQGAENVEYSGMSCFLCSYPMVGLSQPLFEYVSLSSVNNLNPVPTMEQCHFQR